LLQANTCNHDYTWVQKLSVLGDQAMLAIENVPVLPAGRNG